MVINLKKKLLFVLIFIIIVCVLFGIYFFIKNNNTYRNDYSSSKTSTSQNTSSKNNINETNTIQITQNLTGSDNKNEEELSSFSTKIYTKDTSRQNNISITCSTLNETIIPNGSTFSFCNTIGQSTSSKGYQKADIFDSDGTKKKGLGGGNCQVSTTLYNAVLNVSSLVVTERHEHSNKVPYIQNGMDAAVAYGSYDLKFRNETGFDIKIKASNTSDIVSISLYKIF